MNAHSIEITVKFAVSVKEKITQTSYVILVTEIS